MNPHDSSVAPTWQMLETAVRAQARGDARAAIDSCLKVLAMEPSHAQALRYLGLAHQMNGDAARARAALEAASHCNPADPEAHAALGWFCTSRQALDEAALHYGRALELAPFDPQHWKNLGTVHRAANRLHQAASCLRRALDLEPRSASIAFALGNVLAEDGRVDEAILYLRLAVHLNPRSSAFHNDLAIQLQYAGAIDAALAHYRSALDLDVDNSEARVNLAKCLAAKGETVAAQHLYRAVIDTHPLHAEAHAGLIVLEPRAAPAASIGKARTLLADSATADGPRLKLHYALARHFDAVGEFEVAFEHAERYNEAVRRLNRRPPANLVEDFNRLVAVFTPERIATLGAHGNPQARLVFIVGMPRSGTTLVEAILAKHPEVRAAGELQNLNRIVKDLPFAFDAGVPYPECVMDLNATMIRRLAATYLHGAEAHDPLRFRVTDKLPMNFAHVGLIAILFPASRIVHCHRSPADTSVSCFFEDFGTQYAFLSDFRSIGRYYRHYARLMEYWETVLPARIHTVSYESLVDDLEGTSRSLLDHLELDWQPECLEFHRTDRAILTPSHEQVRRSIYAHSIGRWRHYAAHLDELFEVLREEPRPKYVTL